MNDPYSDQASRPLDPAEAVPEPRPRLTASGFPAGSRLHGKDGTIYNVQASGAFVNAEKLLHPPLSKKERNRRRKAG